MQETIKTYKVTDTVEFKIFPGTIGVCVSGGLDSALLLYFTLKYTTEPVHVFSFASQEKKIRNVHAALNVVNACIELTNNYKVLHHIVYDKSQNKKNLFELPVKQLLNSTISTLYTGVTKNPPKSITDKFILETMENDERNPDVVRQEVQNNWYMPWTNLDKRDLFEIYSKHNLLENLFPVTRSCEWINHEWPDPGYGHCGKCWWCQEREWGFGKT